MINLGVKWSVRIENESELEAGIKVLEEYVPNTPKSEEVLINYHVKSDSSADSWGPDALIVPVKNPTQERILKDLHADLYPHLRVNAMLGVSEKFKARNRETYENMFKFPVTITISCRPCPQQPAR